MSSGGAAFLREAKRAAAAVRRRIPGLRARTGLVLGSGLAGAMPPLRGERSIPYASIPGFPKPTVKGHSGKLSLGRRAGGGVAVLQGRLHYYEGQPMSRVIFPLHVLRELGVERLILTSAVGSLRRGIRPGEIVFLEDHINLMGANPLRGLVGPGFGEMFPDMTVAYDPQLRRRALAASRRLRIPSTEGVYVAVPGPSYETPAEIRAFRKLGADVVGMSTVPEVIAARQMGMRVLVATWVANMAAGVVRREALNHAEVLEYGRDVASRMRRLLENLLDEE